MNIAILYGNNKQCANKIVAHISQERYQKTSNISTEYTQECLDTTNRISKQDAHMQAITIYTQKR